MDKLRRIARKKRQYLWKYPKSSTPIQLFTPVNPLGHTLSNRNSVGKIKRMVREVAEAVGFCSANNCRPWCTGQFLDLATQSVEFVLIPLSRQVRFYGMFLLTYHQVCTSLRDSTACFHLDRAPHDILLEPKTVGIRDVCQESGVNTFKQIYPFLWVLSGRSFSPS